MQIQKNILLKDYTTFKIGGPAEYFVDAKTIEDVQEAVKWAKENKQSIFVLGGGSNLIVSDAGLKGLVIKLSLEKLEFEGQIARVGSGVKLAYLLNQALDHDLTGLEFAAGIPGTVGGATRGNAGTYGLAMDSVVTKVIYLDENFQVQEMENSKAEFSYRHSIFKKNPYIILEVEIKLEKGNVEQSRMLVNERLQYRNDTQPKEPSAGCIFKNVKFDEVDIEDLKNRGIEIEKFEKFQKIPTAYLIEKVGLKGHTIGGAQISEIHGNYIVNKGNATAEHIVMLISFIKQQIRDKYGIQIQEEVQLLL